MLRNVLELAGLNQNRCDFNEQHSRSSVSDSVARQPDVVVNMPGGARRS